MQSVVTVWYLSAGRDLPEGAQEREVMGPWDSEWSLRHMLKVLRRAILGKTINLTSAQDDETRQIMEALKNLVIFAA